MRVSFYVGDDQLFGQRRAAICTRDWPFNQHNAGHIPAPYPDIVAHLTTLWMLSPYTPENGATIIVPGSHRMEDESERGFVQP